MNLSPGKHKATLVVGTTSDYIEWIRRINPDRNIFLTDLAVRQKAQEPAPQAKEEILCDLADYQLAGNCLREHLEYWKCKLDGITCFDCESMELAAHLAEQYRLPYPSGESIGLCRNKYLSKLRWKENGLCCPETKVVSSAGEAETFFKKQASPMILKPRTGSGSEYVYLCESTGESGKYYQSILSSLKSNQANRLYRSSAPVDALIIAEEFISGTEYSCDFIINDNQVQLIRLTRKIRARGMPFGTIHGYVLCNRLPGNIDGEAFLETLRMSAASLQISRGICMLDFIVRGGEMVLLEISPRPGGDCLPYLLQKARGLDMLKLSLDFARQEPLARAVDPVDDAAGFMGIRIIAPRSGILRTIDVGALAQDARVLEIGLAKNPGHVIILPPADYDSWILGYVIARTEADKDPHDLLTDISGKINIVTDSP